MNDHGKNKEHLVKHYLSLILVPLLAAACGGTDTRVESSVEVPVSVEDVVLKPIEEFVVITGTVNATKEVLLKAESAGFYRLATNPKTSRAYELGDFVSKGQVIIYLDNPEQEFAIKVESHKLNLENTRNELEKQKSLYDKGGVTLSELNTAERQYVDAKYNYDNALLQLDKLKVTTPFDGVVVDIPYYTKGVKVAVNSDMVHMMNYSKLNMEVNLPGKLLGEVIVGQPVRVMNYTMPDKVLHGGVTQVSPALDPGTRTFKAKIDIDNPDWLLRPGMFVKAEITTARKDSTVVISKDIILTRRNQKRVFVVNRGIAQEKTITTGLENPDEIEVVEGLEKDERLVIKGFETLRNGSRVKITR